MLKEFMSQNTSPPPAPQPGTTNQDDYSFDGGSLAATEGEDSDHPSFSRVDAAGAVSESRGGIPGRSLGNATLGI